MDAIPGTCKNAAAIGANGKLKNSYASAGVGV
jgi:hypothetical protein